ncbi:MAG: ORF6N domain-containing protein [Bacteroidota bacterium]
MISVHLAELYGVETRTLNQAVKRNTRRFPSDFMFQLSEREADLLVSQNVIPHRKFFGGSIPYAFMEQGVAMLSTVLRSARAIQMNITIMSRRDGFAACLCKTPGDSFNPQRACLKTEST